MNVLIGSDQERENLFAEIRHGDSTWADVVLNEETGRFELTIYALAEGEELKFELGEVEEALAEAKAALLARGYRERSA